MLKHANLELLITEIKTTGGRPDFERLQPGAVRCPTFVGVCCMKATIPSATQTILIPFRVISHQMFGGEQFADSVVEKVAD